MKINYNHGGARIGAGRKKNTGKFKEKTQVMRIPISLVNNVGQALKEYKKEIDKFSVPTPNAPDVSIPFFSSRVQAGFPSPADDHLEDSLDLNKYLIHHEESTFFVRAQGDSMLGAGIYPGDILVVDKSLDAKNGKIVIAVVDGEFTVKRLQRYQNKITLKSENPNYRDIDIKKENELTIWGVVTSVIHKYL
ncbi:MAG: translesion error-prone DNA polymerase V autoproteolytic subunit [Gammaproteobacteria bacterium]|jgi:DNA polymerase V